MRAANPLNPNAPDHAPQRAALVLPRPDPPDQASPPAGKPPQGATAPPGQSSQESYDDLQAIAPTALWPDLPVAELRRPLFQESGHAFLLIFGGEQRVEQAALGKQAFPQGCLLRAADRLFRGHDR